MTKQNAGELLNDHAESNKGKHTHTPFTGIDKTKKNVGPSQEDPVI
jgi:hypothetical protein